MKNLTFYTRKSNVSRIEDQQFFDKGVEKFLQESVIQPLDQSLDSLSTQIANVLNIIPIYYKFLKNIEGLSMYDSAELICIIKDINRFKRFVTGSLLELFKKKLRIERKTGKGILLSRYAYDS